MTNSMNVLLTFVRGHRHYTKAWLRDAVKYDAVKYHPRRKDHVDPPIVPSKVLMVRRVKPFRGNPYWEKDILTGLGLGEGKTDLAFVKNTPEMCALLWKIKHLVKIVPVKLPETLPNMDDFVGTHIADDGTFHVTGKLDPARYEATLKAHSSVKRMESAAIEEKLRLQWIKGYLL